MTVALVHHGRCNFWFRRRSNLNLALSTEIVPLRRLPASLGYEAIHHGVNLNGVNLIKEDQDIEPFPPILAELRDGSSE